MQKILSFLICLVLLTGCASAPKKKTAPANIPKEEIHIIELNKPDTSPELENVTDEVLAQEEEERGVVFAKTDFQGVLKTSYVRLMIEDVDDVENKFQLHIGEPNRKSFLWDVKAVEPGYFFIELPEGRYQVTAISIPVGSTMATEPIDISFEVEHDNIIYLGTLMVNGTKEKIKLGGLPIIRPGFEYLAEIKNEFEEAMDIFQERYPTVERHIITQLMLLKPQQAISPQ